MALASIMVAIFLALLCVDGAKQIRTAVFLEENEKPDANSYSSYLAHLTDRGHAVSYFSQASTDFALAKYGELAFDHVVILDPTLTTLGATKLEKNDLLSFVEQGGNVIVAGSIRVSKMLRQFAAECGIDFDKKGSLVMDHVNHLHDSTDVYHSLIKTTQWINSPIVVGTLQKPIVYNGIGMTVEPTNVLTFTVLSAESSAYSAVPTKPIEGSKDAIFGTNVGLVTAVQARNNARVLVAGSLDLFKNTYTTSPNYDNGRFVKTFTDWALGERGVLRVSNVNHSREDGSLPDKMLNDSPRPDEPITLYPDAEIARNSLVYRIKDNVTYSFDVHEFRDGHWTPFAADDLQLEFVMLDPYVRKTMTHDSHGHFTTTFTAPDTYGIFQFRVVYRRVGYSVLHWTTQVSLRPYKHDEYERFIPAAFPYYASAFSMMAGVLIFSVVFLYGGDDA